MFQHKIILWKRKNEQRKALGSWKWLLHLCIHIYAMSGKEKLLNIGCTKQIVVRMLTILLSGKPVYTTWVFEKKCSSLLYILGL